MPCLAYHCNENRWVRHACRRSRATKRTRRIRPETLGINGGTFSSYTLNKNGRISSSRNAEIANYLRKNSGVKGYRSQAACTGLPAYQCGCVTPRASTAGFVLAACKEAAAQIGKVYKPIQKLIVKPLTTHWSRRPIAFAFRLCATCLAYARQVAEPCVSVLVLLHATYTKSATKLSFFSVHNHIFPVNRIQSASFLCSFGYATHAINLDGPSPRRKNANQDRTSRPIRSSVLNF
jgi:hypothetical protein